VTVGSVCGVHRKFLPTLKPLPIRPKRDDAPHALGRVFARAPRSFCTEGERGARAGSPSTLDEGEAGREAQSNTKKGGVGGGRGSLSPFVIAFHVGEAHWKRFGTVSVFDRWVTAAPERGAPHGWQDAECSLDRYLAGLGWRAANQPASCEGHTKCRRFERAGLSGGGGAR
jgi:hypothetical protein